VNSLNVRRSHLRRVHVRRSLLATLLGSAALCIGSRSDAAPFTLHGKTVTVTVSGGVGGGVDVYTRTLLPYLTKYLPGHPVMIIQNMPGGGGVQGVQNLYNIARADGTAFGTTPGGPLKEPLMGSHKVNYDLRKFGWFGSLVGVDDTVCIVGSASPVKSVADARTRPVTLSSTGSESNSTLGPLLLNNLLGTRFKPISGYDGGTAMLAVERGEVDGRCVTMSSIKATHPEWLTTKSVRILLTMSKSSDPAEAGAPVVADLLKTDVEKSAFKFFQGPDEIQEPFMLPPATPPEVLTTYRAAFDAAVRDPDYVAESKKARQFVSPRRGDDVASVIESMYATPPAVIQRVKTATSVTDAEINK